MSPSWMTPDSPKVRNRIRVWGGWAGGVIFAAVMATTLYLVNDSAALLRRIDTATAATLGNREQGAVNRGIHVCIGRGLRLGQEEVQSWDVEWLVGKCFVTKEEAEFILGIINDRTKPPTPNLTTTTTEGD